jgi:hypothetical protein
MFMLPTDGRWGVPVNASSGLTYPSSITITHHTGTSQSVTSASLTEQQPTTPTPTHQSEGQRVA